MASEIAVTARRGGPQRVGLVSRHAGLADSTFLVLVILASVIPYAGRLGFYSDDWAFLGALHTSDDQTVLGLASRQLQFPYPVTPSGRPVQVVYQAALYKLFGLEPLGYHLVNTAMLIVMALLLSLTLRELGLPRPLVLATPLVFALLPNYSTDRFWFAAFGYILSMALCFLSLYANLRAVRTRGVALLSWKLVSLIALVTSGLGIEIAIPLLALNPILAFLHARRHLPGGLKRRLGRWPAGLFLSSDLLLLLVVLAYKRVAGSGLGLPAGWIPFHIGQLVFGSTAINFGTYGVGLPYTVWRSVADLSWPLVAVGMVLAAAVYGYFIVALRGEQEHWAVSRPAWIRLAVVGTLLYALSYALFLPTGRIVITSTGIGNRVAVAATLGMAIVLLAACGWLSSLARSPTSRRRSFSMLVAGLCLSGFIVTNSVALYWQAASSREAAVLRSIRQALPDLPPHSTLILHGICPYVGPGIVFESDWDLSGALQVMYRDETIRADVTRRMTITSSGLSTRTYGAVPVVHRFGGDLLLYDYSRSSVTPLPDERTALRALGSQRPAPPPGCEKGAPGRGVTIFPTDELYFWLEVRRFHP
jgi:hypothetical protein